MAMDLRQRLFQYRSYTPIPFLLVMVAIAHPSLLSIAGGLLIVLLGEFLRLWGVAIAGSETRTTGPVGGTFLITRGPFAHLRNPLYLGNMIIYFGIGVMSNTPVLACIALLYFIVQYTLIVTIEEEYLQKTFKEEYLRYARAVRRFLPSVRGYRDGSQEQPALDWKRGFISEKRTLQAIGCLTVLLLVLRYVRS